MVQIPIEFVICTPMLSETTQLAQCNEKQSLKNNYGMRTVAEKETQK